MSSKTEVWDERSQLFPPEDRELYGRQWQAIAPLEPHGATRENLCSSPIIQGHKLLRDRCYNKTIRKGGRKRIWNEEVVEAIREELGRLRAEAGEEPDQGA
jgi:hypothetical protein